MSFLLDSVKFMMIGGDKRDAQPFCKRQRKGIGKGDSFFDLDNANLLYEGIIRVSAEFKRQRQGVCPGGAGCARGCRTGRRYSRQLGIRPFSVIF